MKMHSLFSRQKAVLAVLPLLFAAYAVSAAASDCVLLFAPGEYEHQKAAPFHQNAAQNIHDRLLKANISEDQIVWLRGKDATAQAFRKALSNMANSIQNHEDLFFVAICSPGLELDHKDCVLSADTPEDPKTEKDGKDAKIISLAEVVKKMSISSSDRRILMVDGASVGDFSQTDAAIHFGHTPLNVSDGQWVIINQSNSVSARGDQPAITHFIWSFLDGISIHADGNRDGSVTALELADYMKLYAEEQGMSTPRFFGKATEDMKLVATSAATDEKFPREKLAENARRLITEARKALRLDLDVQAALALADRAKRLCNTPEIKDELDMVSASAKIMSGKADEVLPLENNGDALYEAVLCKDTLGYNPAKPSISQKLSAGSVVYIKNRVSSPSTQGVQTYLCVVTVLQMELKEDQTSYTPIKLVSDPIWVQASELVASTSQTAPPISLRRQFLKTNNVSQTPASKMEEEEEEGEE